MHPALRQSAGKLDDAAAAHLWRRAGFGASPSTIEATARLSPAAAAARLVDGPSEDPAVRELDAIRTTVVGANDPDGARAWLIARMVRSEHQVREKLALFWHGHFATSIAKVRDLDWMMDQYGLFLRHGLGKFGDLLAAVTRDPAMIRWLDNDSNRKGQPNENFARELFELFTLGDGNYTEKDIQEAARAFTGWHVLHGRFHFSKLLHDDGEKTVLGARGAFGGDDVLRLALAQPACADFLARKLLAFYVAPDVADEVVAGLADVLRERDYDLAATLRVLFASKLFHDPAVRGTLVKSPLDYVVGAARVFEARIDAKAAARALREMGQDLLAPPNVKGWPGHDRWINTATWLTRVNAARAFAGRAAETKRSAAAWDRAAQALLGVPVPEEERRALLAAGGGDAARVHALLALPEAHVL